MLSTLLLYTIVPKSYTDGTVISETLPPSDPYEYFTAQHLSHLLSLYEIAEFQDRPDTSELLTEAMRVPGLVHRLSAFLIKIDDCSLGPEVLVPLQFAWFEYSDSVFEMIERRTLPGNILQRDGLSQEMDHLTHAFWHHAQGASLEFGDRRLLAHELNKFLISATPMTWENSVSFMRFVHNPFVVASVLSEQAVQLVNEAVLYASENWWEPYERLYWDGGE